MRLRYKYRLYPNREQETKLRQFGGSCRYLWNQFIEQQKQEHKHTGKFIFYNEMARQLVCKKKDTSWLQETHSQILQQKLKDLDQALKNFFKHGRGFPKFKEKRNFSDSFRYAQGLKYDGNKVYLPKIGWVKRGVHRKLPSNPSSATVIQDGNKWFISFVVEVECQPTVQVKEAVGIDLGIKDFLVTSDGEIVENPKFLDKSLKQLRKKQRQLSRKHKGSNNRRKQQLVVYNQHKKIRNQRRDFLHRISSQITNDYDLICTEDLNVSGMTKNRSLARSIGQAGWSTFVQMLQYKSKLKCKAVVKISRFAPSSQACAVCGKRHTLTLRDRVFSCDCGSHSVDRDLNAALNIVRWGIEEYTRGTREINACGDPSTGDILSGMSRYVSLKQEAADDSSSSPETS